MLSPTFWRFLMPTIDDGTSIVLSPCDAIDRSCARGVIAMCFTP